MKKTAQRGLSPIAVHAGLAGLGLLLAFTTWTRDRTQVQTDMVVALDFGKRDVASLRFEDETRTVSVERKTGDAGEHTWVTVSTRSKQLVTNPLQPAGAPVPAAPGNPHGAPGAAPGAAMDPHGHGAPGAAMDPHGHGAPAAPPTVAPTAPKAVPGQPAAKPAPAAPAQPAGKPAAAQKGGDKAIVESAGGRAAPPGATVQPPVPPAPGATPAAGASPAAAPAAPQPIHEVKETVTTKSFRGNEQADKLFEQFAPMRVVRALGSVDEKKAKELGLDAPKKKLTVQAKGQTYVFSLGQNSYGAGDIYARDAQGQVFLLSHRMVSDFEFAESRLMERRLHRFERSEFDRIEVEVMTAAGPKKRTLIQKNRQDNANYYFADGATPDKRDDTLKNWVDKILRMAINDYVAQGEEPKTPNGAPATPIVGEVLKLRFLEGSKEIGSAVFSRYPMAGQSGVAQQPQGQDYFARTETTIGLVRLLAVTADSAVTDAEKW